MTQKLHVDELPTKLRAFRCEFQVDTEIFGGTTTQEEVEVEGMWELERVLEKSVQ